MKARLKKIAENLVRLNGPHFVRLNGSHFLSAVNKHNIKLLFFNFVRFHIIFIGFLGKTQDLYAISFYTIILALYFLGLLGSLGSFILYYILIVGFLLRFSVNFPPLREKMFGFFGGKFILKHLKDKRFPRRD